MDKEILELLKLMRDDMKLMQNDMKKMDSKIDKNTLKLEELNTKISTIAEVQKNHMDQNEKAHNDIIKSFSEKGSVIELAVKNTSKNITELKDKFDKVEKVTMQNTYDVAYLKSVK